MVVETGAQFQQFIHCKFRETVVRALYIPATPHSPHPFVLVVNKFGKVGLYDPDRFMLLHTYLLDLSLWLHPDTTPLSMTTMAKGGEPRCQRSHLIVDAIFAPQLSSVFYLSNKGVLQGFDIGAMETQRYGIELLPDKSFGQLRSRATPNAVRNRGHVETHRIYGLPPFLTCMEYFPGEETALAARGGGDDIRSPGEASSAGMLLIGSSDGTVTLLRIPHGKNSFWGRNIRGVVHQIKFEELVSVGLVRVYRGHNGPITDLLFVPEHQLIVTTSKDMDFSLTLKDLRGVVGPSIISLPKGANTVGYSETLKMIATGSDDSLVRVFNQFVPKKPLAELPGHRARVISVEFITVPFSPRPTLFSFSTDVEVRAWDPVTFEPIQSLYVSFPIKSTIICKTPEFPRRAMMTFQPFQESTPSDGVKGQTLLGGFLLVFYSNSFAKLRLQREYSYWPFDFDELCAGFESVATRAQRKKKGQTSSPSPNSQGRYHLLSPSEIDQVEMELESVMTMNQERMDKVAWSGTQEKPTSVSGQLARSCYSLRTDKGKMQRLLDGGAFKVVSTVDIEDPIQFVPPPPGVTEVMEATGLSQVTCPEHLLGPTALKCFSTSWSEIKMAASVAKMSYAQILRQGKGNESGRSWSSEEGRGSSNVICTDDAGGRASRSSLISDIDPPLEILGDETDSDSDLGGVVDDDEYVRRSLRKLMDDVTPEPPCDV